MAHFSRSPLPFPVLVPARRLALCAVLAVALLPSTANGQSPTYGWVQTDYVEAIVSYRR